MASRAFILLVLTSFTFFSCKVTEQSVAGTYRLNTPSKTKLVLNKDNTFEFVKNFSQPGPAFFPDSTEMNFRTTGQWKLDENNQLILNSTTDRMFGRTISEQETVTPNASITSFSFYDSYGDPVAIRFMKFAPNKIKFYRANAVSFFADDFSQRDTLEFHFYGYKPVKWPGHFTDGTKGNHNYRITLFEETRQGYFSNLVLSAEKNKLISTDKSFALYKKR